MKEQATHIRLIRDSSGKPVEAEYMQDTKPYSFEGLELVKSFNAWAKANRIPVTGDWPDREVFAMEEVEPVEQYLEREEWVRCLPCHLDRIKEEGFETRTVIKLKQ